MKNHITVLFIASLVVLASLCHADSIALKKTGTGVTCTVKAVEPMQLDSVAFTLPAVSTNTFTVSATRDVVERTLVGAVISTNLYGRIETNTNYQVTTETHTIVTNQLMAINTTNAGSTLIYTTDSGLPEGYQLTDGDKLIFSWTDTNTFYFIYNLSNE